MSLDLIIAKKQSNICPICPSCGKSGIIYPHRFRPPRKSDNKKWEVVKYLHQNGFIYHHISDPGIEGYVKYPETLKEAIDFVKKYK